MAKRLEDARSAGRRRRREEAAEGPQEQWPRRRRRSRHRRDERQAPERGQQQAQAPEARRENATGRAADLRIADNVPCPVHPGAGHTWGECRENARNRANNRNNAPGAVGGQRRGGGPAPLQRGEAQGHYVETIDSTMEQEDVSELPGGPTEVSDPSPMEEEQFIIDERAPRAAVAESFPALSFPASPPSLDSTGRPTLVHRTRPSQWGASSVPPARATSLPPHTQWGHRKSPGKQTVPRKEYDQPSAAAVKKAPQVAAPQPSPKDETPAPSESGNDEYLLPIFHFNPFGTAKAVQETHHLDLFSSNDSFFDQSLDPNGISIGTTMFPSMVLLQPIDELIPSFPAITTHSCASSGSAPTYVSAKEELKWPEASWFATAGTGKYGKGQTSPNGSTSHTRPVGLTALMSSTPPQPCERSERATLKPSMTRPTCGSTSRRMISVTPGSTSWTLVKPEEKNTSIYCFTSTSRKNSCRHPGNATTTKSIEHGPKRARSSSRKGSSHSKTQESTGTKPMPFSTTSVKKRGTLSDSEPSATNQRKLSNSTTCSSATSQTGSPGPSVPNQAEKQAARASTMQRSLLTPNCRQLPCLTPLTESELQGLCTSVLTETFPEVCVTDAVIPDPCEHAELDPTALQWRDSTSSTFSPSSQLVPISLATVHQFLGVSSPTPLVVLFDCGSQLSFLKRSKVPKDCEKVTVEQPVRGLTGTSHLTEEVTLTGITLPEFSASKRIDSSLHCLLLDERQEDSTYDLILGLDFLCAVGIDILCSQKQLQRDDATLAFQPRDTFQGSQASLHAWTLEAFAYGDDDDDPEGLGYKSTQIMEAKYEAIDTEELAQAQTHSRQSNGQSWHASFASFPNSLTASCACIRTASITWISKMGQNLFIPVPTGYHSRNEKRLNASLIISSRLAF